MDPEDAVYAIATNMAKKKRQNASVDNPKFEFIKERLYKELSKVK